ncbi:MAG TPA: type I methionyl aminopeptidase [Dehalococcoidia bacterium]|nr:type I methionyl aminopeptidase [Dehalococcoidia bacterium]
MTAHAERLITIKSDEEVAIMREAGQLTGQVLQMLVEATKPGVTLKELDKIVRTEYAKRGAVPTFLGYPAGSKNPYPATVCISLNEELVHGIPVNVAAAKRGDRVIREGDIVSIDLGATYKGFVGDTAVTFGVGKIDPEAQRLIDVTRESLRLGIEAARAGVRLGVVSGTIGDYIESQGLGVVRNYGGHGVGRQMHEEPFVPNFGKPSEGRMLRKGMVLALEPMVTIGDYRTKTLADGWTVTTLDGSLCAHFEHTIAITDGEAQVLTLP